jgi:hypothetical protein
MHKGLVCPALNSLSLGHKHEHWPTSTLAHFPRYSQPSMWTDSHQLKVPGIHLTSLGLILLILKMGMLAKVLSACGGITQYIQ